MEVIKHAAATTPAEQARDYAKVYGLTIKLTPGKGYEASKSGEVVASGSRYVVLIKRILEWAEAQRYSPVVTVNVSPSLLEDYLEDFDSAFAAPVKKTPAQYPWVLTFADGTGTRVALFGSRLEAVAFSRSAFNAAVRQKRTYKSLGIHRV